MEVGLWLLQFVGWFVLSGLVSGLLVGIIPAIVGAVNKQPRLGRAGLFACTVSGLLCGSLLASIGVCAVFVWLMLSLKRDGLSEVQRTELRQEAIRVVSLIVLVFAVLGMLALAHVVAFTAPVFQGIYGDFGSELPAITAFFTSNRVPFLLCVAVLIAALIVKEIAMANKTTALAINVVASVGSNASVLASIVALYLPIFTLGETITGV